MEIARVSPASCADLLDVLDHLGDLDAPPSAWESSDRRARRRSRAPGARRPPSNARACSREFGAPASLCLLASLLSTRDHLGVLLLASGGRAVLAVAGDVEDGPELLLLLERLA